MESKSANCSRCNAPLRRDPGGGVCAACLFEEVLPDAEGRFRREAQSLDITGPERQWVGDYELLEEIGRGGMGVIYKARQHGLDRIVALKMLLLGEFADAEARRKLLREAKIAARLSHPNIITIHEVGEENGCPFFAMEYVAGRNLSEITRDGLLSLANAARYVEQLARAVHYAHQNGIVHRDIKPANVLVGLDGEPKLGDFGLTKSLQEQSLTIESAGSPNFMAPEQADPKRGRTGPCTDVFGLGGILYYLLTGRPPFLGESLSETLRAVLEQEPVSLRALRPALPRDLETITLKCLEKDPARRYGSALEIAEELARWRGHEPIRARPAGAVDRFRKWVRRRPAVAGLLAAFTLSLLLGITGILWQWRRAELQREDALRHAYVSDIQAASRVLVDHNLGRARQILDRNRPRAGERDLRGWEWRYLWQFCRGDAASTVCQRSDVIFSIVPDPRSRWIAIGEAMGGLTLWNPRNDTKIFETSEPINRFAKNSTPEGNRVRTRIAAIPGSSLLAYCASMDGTNPVVNLWNAESRHVERSLPQPYLVRDLAVTPDGRRLVVTTFNPAKTAVLWDLQTGKELARYRIEFPDFSVGNPLAISPDGRFATFDEDRLVRVVDLQSGEDRWRLPTRDLYAGAAAFSPDGRWLATGNGYSDPVIQLWDMESGAEAARFEGQHQGWVRDLLFTPDGAKLISASADQAIIIWDFATRRPIRTLRGHNSEVSALALSADGQTLYSGDKSGAVMTWRLDQLPPENRGAHRIHLPVLRWTFLPGGSDLLVTTTNHTVVRVAGPAFDKFEPFAEAGADCVGAQAFSTRTRYIVFHENGDVTIHNPEKQTIESRWHITDQKFLGIGLLPKTEDIIVVTADLRGRTINSKTGKIISEWAVPDWGFTQQLSEDGKSLWALNYDGSVSITGTYDGRTRKARFDHGNTVALAFNSEAPEILATCSDTGFVRLVSRQTLETLRVLGRYRLAVWSACFAPGERLATVGNGDEDLKLWDLRTGRELLTLTSDETHGNPVKASPDGTTFAQFGVPEGELFVWRAPSWGEIESAEALTEGK